MGRLDEYQYWATVDLAVQAIHDRKLAVSVVEALTIGLSPEDVRAKFRDAPDDLSKLADMLVHAGMTDNPIVQAAAGDPCSA